MDIILSYPQVRFLKIMLLFVLSTSVLHGGFLEYGEPNCLEQKLNFYV